MGTLFLIFLKTIMAITKSQMQKAFQDKLKREREKKIREKRKKEMEKRMKEQARKAAEEARRQSMKQIERRRNTSTLKIK
tara:strand:+ start:70 stop:309 length:240 start_codon:yes stop_codon:yes gene_type:complete